MLHREVVGPLAWRAGRNGEIRICTEREINVVVKPES